MLESFQPQKRTNSCFWCGDIINMEIYECLCQLPLKMVKIQLFIIIVPLFQPLNPHSGLFFI